MTQMTHAVIPGLEQVLIKTSLFVQIGNKLFVFLNKNTR